jgi:aerobic-type carbon monoxide dehydrogenase small subunit (CoxS/CutS family)
VLVDGKRIFSCITPVSAMQDKSITTIEGVAQNDKLHPLQQAFLDEAAFQCAYCTSGMIIAGLALLDHKPNPSDQEIIDGMNGNVCRCCAQPQILKAVRTAATQLAAGEARP